MNLYKKILFFSCFILFFSGCFATKHDVTNARLDVRELQREISLLRFSQAELMTEISEQNEHLRQISGKVDDNRNKFSEINDKAVNSKDIANLSERLASVESRLYKLWISTMPIALATSDDIYNTAYNDYLKGKYDLAISGYKKYLSEYDNEKYSPLCQYGLALIFYEKEEWDKCFEELEVYLNLYPEHEVIVKARLMKARVFRKLGKFDEARGIYKSIINENPDTEEEKFARDELDFLMIE